MAEFYNCLEDIPIEKLNITMPNFHSGAQKILAFNKALKNSNELRKQNAWSLILEIERNLKILMTKIIYFLWVILLSLLLLVL